MRIDEYSNELIEKIIEEKRSTFECIEKNIKNGVLIYGAGFIGTWAAKYLKDIGIDVKYFIDRDKSKWNTKLLDIEIIAPEDDKIAQCPFILIAAHHAVDTVMEMYNKTDYILMPFEGYYCIKNYEEYKDVRDNYLEDQRSKNTYNALMYTCLTGDSSACGDVMEKDMYFSIPEFSGGVKSEIFVDAGAFVGDTVENFIWEHLGAFTHIYAFEPSDRQFKAMAKRMERVCEEWCIEKEKISLVKAGLSNKNGTMSCICASDTPMRDTLIEGENGNCVDVYTLDEYLQGKEVTFIKADIEGMEMEMLEGARNTIEKYKPKMAVCVYHYPCDLYCIPKYIRQINPDYKFKLRLHTPSYVDFVLYCY